MPAAKSKTVRIDVWIWSLDLNPGRRAELKARLSPDEVARAHRFLSPRDEAHFIAARGRLRELLAAACNIAPAAIDFAYGKHGKPELAPPTRGPNFNLSHSRGTAALAICHEARVGLDIETVRPVREGVAARFFTPTENAALSRLPDAEWLAGFYRCWTRKEAFIKAIGSGIFQDLRAFDVSIDETPTPRLIRFDRDPRASENWAIRTLDLNDGLVGALAVECLGREIDVSLHDDRKRKP